MAPQDQNFDQYDVFQKVKDDLTLRDHLGYRQHQRPLDARDYGRNWLQEAYEEALDLAIYLKAELLRNHEFHQTIDQEIRERQRE